MFNLKQYIIGIVQDQLKTALIPQKTITVDVPIYDEHGRPGWVLYPNSGNLTPIFSEKSPPNYSGSYSWWVRATQPVPLSDIVSKLGVRYIKVDQNKDYVIVHLEKRK